MNNLPRLYYNKKLIENDFSELYDSHYHYLHKVMRLKKGHKFKIFNGTNGEFLAIIENTNKNSLTIRIEENIRLPFEDNKISLAFAPLKNPYTSLVIQKATELGVNRIFSILTKHSVIRSINGEKLKSIAIDAVEQCEGFSPPIIITLQTLREFLITKPFNGKLIFCCEREKSLPLIEVVSNLGCKDNVILIGPEGGFSQSEKELIQSFDYVTRASLGSRILRAETAIISALSIYQAVQDGKK